MKCSVFIKLVRAEDYVKNVLIFAPVFFAGKVTDSNLLPSLFAAFAAFCLISSSVYIFNDYLDREFDKLHAIKKYRPQAAGTVKGKTASFIALIFLLFGEMVAWWIGNESFWIFQIYIFQNILYSIFLKKIIFLDILIISLGYVWRIYMGGQIADVPITNWLYLMTILIMLTLSLGKRFTDLNVLESNVGNHSRAMIIPYTNKLLKVSISAIVFLNMVVYVFYTIYPNTINRVGSTWYFLTAIPVGIGLFQYARQILKIKNSVSPVQLLFQDNILKICVLVWLLAVAFFNYSPNV
ncbi:MAG: UbiA prenyltransferase family protein [Bacteroidetes bacterium]|nr:UbiA prenyltransferase family protein [Bacteroidota bacterium]